MLEVKNLTFSYRDHTVIEDLSLLVPKNAHVALIGESGCGKSTLLRLIYGLYDLDSGTIDFDGKPVLGPAYHLVPGMDYMKFLAQDFDLMPFTTTAENVGKYLSNIYKDRKKQRVDALLDLVGMRAFADVKPKELSGGQQQRVALARVLALEPELLLLDEPFSQIDAFRRNALRRNLFQYLKKQDIGCVFATHDHEDILGFADVAVVMRAGKILHVATPQQLYDNPPDFYTASLFGEVNRIPAAVFGSAPDSELLVYPHQLVPDEASGFVVTVTQNYFQGSGWLVASEFDGAEIFFWSASALPIGTKTGLRLKK